MTHDPGFSDDARDRCRGALLGLACGDALGTTLEFCARDAQPLHTELLGGGAFGVEPGEWTDDTAMALCLAESLLVRRAFDPLDQLDRYGRWLTRGHLSCQGRCIDIGNTTLEALRRYQREGSAQVGGTASWQSGNGGIMRLAPVVLAAAGEGEAIALSMASSRTTHASPDCLDAAALMGAVLWRLLKGMPLPGGLAGIPAVPTRGQAISRIQRGEFRRLSRDAISSSGYVIDTLEAALWCCHHAASPEEALVLAANLADDADTVGAVTGQLAGAAWGARRLPTRWRCELAWEERITDFADRLAALSLDAGRLADA